MSILLTVVHKQVSSFCSNQQIYRPHHRYSSTRTADFLFSMSKRSNNNNKDDADNFLTAAKSWYWDAMGGGKPPPRRKPSQRALYLARLQEAAQDPESFARFVKEEEEEKEEKKEKEKEEKEKNKLPAKKVGVYQRVGDWDANRSKSGNANRSKSKDDNANRSKDGNRTKDDNAKVGVYQRIEDWDANRSKEDMSWEERVKYDGQQFGNKDVQNEILRKNL